jgi:hypothetical protein
MGVEHIFKLLLRPAVENNKLQTVSVASSPANHRYSDHNRRSGACGVDAQRKTATDGKVSLALYFRAGNRQILERSASGQLIGGERGGIIHLDSRSGPRLHTWFFVHLTVQRSGLPWVLVQCAGSNRPNCISSARVKGIG